MQLEFVADLYAVKTSMLVCVYVFSYPSKAYLHSKVRLGRGNINI